ncbi:MAG TPA: AMP-binding protein [Hyphomonadaceae bacterium]|nr:AMP-binding protein [Hyphomonadaceae bacterium]
MARSLEYWSRVRGSEPALFEGETELTYADWNHYADLLADAFADRGLGLDDVIAVRCRNRMEWAVIALACAKLDARLVTLDAGLSAPDLRDRLIAARAAALIIGDADPADVALALEGLPLRLSATLDTAAPGFFNFWDLFGPAAPPRFGRAQPSQLAWTAGSTGAAKAVTLPRRITAPASISKVAIPDRGCSLITVPLHRVWGPVQFWAALGAGRAIAFLRKYAAAGALQLIERRRVSHWSALPESFDAIRRLPADAIETTDLTSLRELVIGGGAVSWPLKAWLLERFGAIVNEAYGSTETGVIALMPGERAHTKPGSCGRAIKGASIEVRDGEGRRLPAGTDGEIWARTPRSLECRLSGPNARRDDNGFVATGDIGRLDLDGFLYITGRTQ